MTYQVPVHMHYRAVNDEIVILDTANDDYLGLNQTAALVWKVVAEGRSSAAAVDELVARFEVTPEIAKTDVAALIDGLLARGLLERTAL